MSEWEEETIPDLSSTASITIMPCLSELMINSFKKLNVIPFYILSPTSIQQLKFEGCEVLDFMPDDLKHLTKLQTLEINYCPILAQRFKQIGEISYEIEIYPEEQEEDNVHIGISCDNCQMFPIVGKRYKCKDCYNVGAGGFDLCEDCYTTPSEHTDLVNQHHTQGHTFELITNRGDNPVQVHPDDPSEDAKGGLVVTKSAEIEEQNKA